MKPIPFLAEALLLFLAACSCHTPPAQPSDAGSTDADCATNNGGCDANSRCVQHSAFRTCICKPWLQGDGLSCASTGLQIGAPWPVEGGNLRHTAQSPFIGPQTGDRVRRLLLGRPRSFLGNSAAIGADGTLYVCGDGATLHAIDTSSPSGLTVKWSFSPDSRDIAACSNPALANDGTLYIGYFTGNARGLYSLDPGAPDSNARVKWFYETKDINGSSPVLGLDGTIYIGTYYHDGVRPLPNGGLYAFRFDTDPTHPQPAWFNSQPLPNSIAPAIGIDGSVYVAGEDGILYAFDGIASNGNWKWRFPSGGIIATDPVISADGTIYLATAASDSSGDIGYLVAADPKAKSNDARTLWSLQVGKFLHSLALAADGTIYVGSSDGSLFAVDPVGAAHGRGLKWTFKAGDGVAGIAIGADGLIYMAGGDRKVYAIDPDGKERWTYETGGAMVSAPAIGADGTIYAASQDGFLYAFGP